MPVYLGYFHNGVAIRKKVYSQSESSNISSSTDSGDTTNVVVLKTAYCEMYSTDDSDLRQWGRILFDDCSQKTYITKELSEN